MSRVGNTEVNFMYKNICFFMRAWVSIKKKTILSRGKESVAHPRQPLLGLILQNK